MEGGVSSSRLCQANPPLLSHCTRPEPLAKPCLVSPARAPRERSSLWHPNPSSDKPHFTLPRRALAFEVGTFCFLRWDENVSSPPTSIWPLELTKMTKKASSGKSSGNSESGAQRRPLQESWPLPGQLGFLSPRACVASPTLLPYLLGHFLPIVLFHFNAPPPLSVSLCPLRRRRHRPVLFLHSRPPQAGLLYIYGNLQVS